MCNDNCSFQLSLQSINVFFLSTSKRSLPTDILYNTSEEAFQRQPSPVLNLGLLNISYKELSVDFLFHHLCNYTSACMHTNTVEIRTVHVFLSVNVSMQQLTFVSSLGLTKFCATCRAKWDTPGLELFYARVGLLPNLPDNKDL